MSKLNQSPVKFFCYVPKEVKVFNTAPIKNFGGCSHFFCEYRFLLNMIYEALNVFFLWNLGILNKAPVPNKATVRVCPAPTRFLTVVQRGHHKGCLKLR